MRAGAVAKVIATIAVCVCSSLPEPAVADSWKIETVELLPRGPFSVLSLGLDDHGDPHLTYGRLGTLIHAFKNADSWTTEVVDSIASSGGTATPRSTWRFSIPSVSIAAGSDRVHMAYIWSAALKHAVRADGGWIIQSIDERASSSTRSLSLALDAEGNPHISYCGYPSHAGYTCSLKYAFASSGIWQVELVDTTTTGSGRTGAPTSALAIKDGIPHIVIMKNYGFLYSLRYVSKQPDWFIETITEDGGENVSLALDSKRRPHVAWAVDNAIRHAWRVGPGDWLVEEFGESAEPTWSLVAIAIDAQDGVHIVHCYEDGVRYLRRRKSADWQVETIDPDAHGGFPFTRIALALEERGQPHVAYVGTDESLPGNRFLRYAHRGP